MPSASPVGDVEESEFGVCESFIIGVGSYLKFGCRNSVVRVAAVRSSVKVAALCGGLCFHSCWFLGPYLFGQIVRFFCGVYSVCFF